VIFSSYQFLLLFLPTALAGYAIASSVKDNGPKYSATWLALCSFAFYAAWNAYFVILLVVSIAVNYTIGTAILNNEERETKQTILTAAGITFNLSVLFFFKYFASLYNFLLFSGIVRSGPELSILLPLGISFFTFTQIGYLVDCRQGLGRQLSLVHYVVFVTFFPHLIAGPILHIREIAPQILNPKTYGLRTENLAAGLSFFVIGLTKKVLLADPLSQLADAGFANVAHQKLFDAWFATLSYSVQLYFDFSGYSDMAIGLAFMFGIRFPLNFNSPYKATSIIDFWQRWHMTLTRYLTLLLFNPLALWVTRRRLKSGKGHRGKPISAAAFAQTVIVPTVYTMFLAGVWHGAGLQFIIFGLLHAFFLSINHVWREYGPKRSVGSGFFPNWATTVFQIALTYVCVLVAQVFFRAASTEDALSMIAALAGLHGVDPMFVPQRIVEHLGFVGAKLGEAGWITQNVPQTWPPRHPFGLLFRYFIIFACPNSQEIMARFNPTLAKVEKTVGDLLAWRPNAIWGGAISCMLFLDLMSLNYSPPFLYFQF
jgi:alginate O-acetyltransferase complex protein AlgI